ncbi:MAG: penicillin-binding protein 2, partial [Armatimonadetes bacterium]|nr:penicillin-binding protein 2 [Armatimonadota bacterium]
RLSLVPDGLDQGGDPLDARESPSQADALSAEAARAGIDSVTRLAPRGLITDRNGTLLAGVREVAVVTAVYDVVKDKPTAKVEVAHLLGIKLERLERLLNEAKWDPYVANVIYVGVDPEAASRIAEAGDRLKGFDIELQPARYYTESTVMSHVLGYVWTPSEREVKRLKEAGIKPAVYVGRDGFEAQYEELLMGSPGAEHMAVDARMRPLRSVGFDRPVPGAELVMSIDVRLQRLAMELLKDRRGAVVATDPRTGEVLCLVSSPTYNITLFDNGISQADYRTLMDSSDLPMLKRAIGGAYPPGSTFKIVTAIAAQLAGEFSPARTVYCRGYYMIRGKRVGCLGRHGTIAFHDAMRRSCNTYFSDLAVRAGEDALREASIQIGLGSRQGIDIPGESSGLVPTAEWIEKTERFWRPGDTVNLGIGQGYLTLTPLQMVAVASVVANRGTVYRPHVLLGEFQKGKLVPTKSEDDDKDDSVIGKIDAPDSFWDELNRALVAVIDRGTARRARIKDISWAGKTGSPEHGRGLKTHSVFIGYAPADDPQIAISVIIEEVGHGSEVAAPMAGEIVERFFDLQKERKEQEEELEKERELKSKETPADQPIDSPTASSRTSSAD